MEPGDYEKLAYFLGPKTLVGNFDIPPDFARSEFEKIIADHQRRGKIELLGYENLRKCCATF